MRRVKLLVGSGIALAIAGLVFGGFGGGLLRAASEGTASEQQGEGSGMMGGYGQEGSGAMQGMMPGGMHGMMGGGTHGKMMTEMRKMREQMDAAVEENLKELRKQLEALREHSEAMAGITDTGRLMDEMRTHMRMTDEVLATMLEQRAKLHATRKAHRARMRSLMMGPGEGSGGGEHGKPETEGGK
jgi:hypothetical protein